MAALVTCESATGGADLPVSHRRDEPRSRHSPEMNRPAKRLIDQTGAAGSQKAADWQVKVAALLWGQLSRVTNAHLVPDRGRGCD